MEKEEKEIKDLKFAIRIKTGIIILGLIIFVGFPFMLTIDLNLNTSHHGGSAANKMSDMEKDIYNAKVKNYLGDVKKGSEVKAMISQIIDMNESNIGKSGMFISILTAPDDNTGATNCRSILETTANLSNSGITNWNDGESLMTKCNAANSFDGGDNTQSNVSDVAEVMMKLKNTINSSNNYMVTADYDNGQIIRVHIAELNISE